MADWMSEAFVVLILCSKCKLVMHQLDVKRRRVGGEFSKIARRCGRVARTTIRPLLPCSRGPADRQSHMLYPLHTLSPLIQPVASSPPSRGNRRVRREAIRSGRRRQRRAVRRTRQLSLPLRLHRRRRPLKLNCTSVSVSSGA